MICLLLLSYPAQQGHAENTGKKRKRKESSAVHCPAKPSRHCKKQPGGRLSNLNLAQLGNVKVTSVSKEPEEVWRTPAAIYVITAEDIRRSGATSIPEALRLAPGVDVARIDSDHWAIGVRGFESAFSKSVLVLIDGRSVYTPLFGGVYWDVQDVPLDDVERIEVIRGPGGTIWGANAVNAVINIITKTAKETHGGLLSLGGGNVDQGTGEFRYGGGNGKGFDYRIYGAGFNRGPELHSDGDPFDRWENGQAGFRTDWETKSRGALTIEGDMYRGSDGERVDIASYSPPAQYAVDGMDRVSGGNLLAHWKKRLGNGSDVQVRAYYDRTSRLSPQFGEVRNTFDTDFLYHMTLPHQEDFLWGIGARFSPSTITQVVPTVNFTPHHMQDNLYTAFVQDEIPLAPNRVWLTVGSKLVHDIYTGFEVEPTARILWMPGPRKTFWAAITRSVRTPARLDEDLDLTGFVTATPLPIFVRIADNGQFFSEQLTGYEAGYRSLVRPRLYVDFEAFHNDYNYLESIGAESIAFEDSPPPLRFVIQVPFANGVMGRSDGFEVAPDWKVNKWWELKGSVAYVHFDFWRKPGSRDLNTVQLYEGSSPGFQASAQSFFNLPRHFEFDQSFRYVGALPDLSVPAYETADVHLGWRPNPHVEFSLSGQNLLQASHIEFADQDPGLPVAIKRSAYGKVTYRW